jgi:hypothetical protein
MHIFFVVFAALVLNVIYRYVMKDRKKWLRIGLVMFVIVFTAFEYLTTYNTPSFDFTKMPSGYYWLKEQKDIKVVAELPMVDALDGMTGQYVTAQIVHGKKLVNMKEPSVDRLNNAIGGDDNPEAINLAYDRGAQAVITHDQKCLTQPVWGKLLYDESKHDSRAKLCIYLLERPVDSDNDFVLFGDGFAYTPVRVKPYEQSAKIAAQTSSFEVTDQNFHNLSGTVRVSTQLRYVSNLPLDTIWKVSQDGVVLAKGETTDRNTKITFSADASKPVMLLVEYNTNHLTVKDVDTYLYDTVAY